MAFTGNNDLIEIVKRNRLRAEAGLPLLSAETEMRRLPAIKPRWNASYGDDQKFAISGSATETVGYQHGPMVSCPPTGARRDAKGPNLTLVNLIGSTHNLLVSQGYRVRDDTWNEMGEELTFSMVLKSAGWRNDTEKLFSFVHS